jgi:hypothetical protein
MIQTWLIDATIKDYRNQSYAIQLTHCVADESHVYHIIQRGNSAYVVTPDEVILLCSHAALRKREADEYLGGSEISCDLAILGNEY